MKQILTLAFLCLFALTALAQQSLKGRVVDAGTNEPLEYVSVYLNNTTRGTATNDKGEFQLPLTRGSYEVIVTYLGYESIVYAVNTDSLPPAILFKLQPKTHMLGVVEIRGQRDAQWHENLEIFKEHFLGRSWIARTCKLLNPEVLVIEFDHRKALLTVRANEPLLIENAALGYKLEYLLADFSFHMREGYVTYQGYPRFELMAGSKSKQRRWVKNRQIAYNGSSMHFGRALQQQRLEEEGFNLRRLYRLPNPNRPTEEELEAARAFARENVLHSNDSIAQVLSRARLPKFVEQLDARPVPYSEYLIFKNGKASVAFEQFLQVVYTGEKEEEAYVRSRTSFLSGKKGPATPAFQTSVFSLHTASVELEEAGNFLNPLDILYEGYWGWEKVGDMLPLDYQN